jgi:hypothetical protein
MKIIAPSIFLGHVNIEYFAFEEDFMEANMRCIPMVVRFKLDAVKIKLSLAAWAKFSSDEKLALATNLCDTVIDKAVYAQFLAQLIEKYTGHSPEQLAESKILEGWQAGKDLPQSIRSKALEFGWEVTLNGWNALSNLQRYSLLKLTKPSHENKNFPIALREFGLV